MIPSSFGPDRIGRRSFIHGEDGPGLLQARTGGTPLSLVVLIAVELGPTCLRGNGRRLGVLFRKSGDVPTGLGRWPLAWMQRACWMKLSLQDEAPPVAPTVPSRKRIRYDAAVVIGGQSAALWWG